MQGRFRDEDEVGNVHKGDRIRGARWQRRGRGGRGLAFLFPFGFTYLESYCCCLHANVVEYCPTCSLHYCILGVYLFIYLFYFKQLESSPGHR